MIDVSAAVPRAVRRAAMIVVVAGCFWGAMHRYAAAGMYTWVDDQGDRHLVDSREKVPSKYRSRAREVSADDSRSPAPPNRDPNGAAEPAPPKSGGSKSASEARGEEPSRSRTGMSAVTSNWLDRARAKWVTGIPALPSMRERISRWLPLGNPIHSGAVVLIAAMFVRVIGAIGALRSARGLAAFGAGYRTLLARRESRSEPAQLERLEQRLPSVHRWCRTARLGVTTIGASREVGMGRVMDEGRVDVLRACLLRPELVGQHTLAVLARAEGVHLHRARRPLSLLGCLEILAFWPRYLAWRSPDDPPGGVRVLLSLYWLTVLMWACFA